MEPSFDAATHNVLAAKIMDVIDRLEQQNATEQRCREYSLAITALEDARNRMRDRAERG